MFSQLEGKFPEGRVGVLLAHYCFFCDWQRICCVRIEQQMNKGKDETSAVPLCCLHFGRVTYKCTPTRKERDVEGGGAQRRDLSKSRHLIWPLEEGLAFQMKKSQEQTSDPSEHNLLSRLLWCIILI